MEEDKAVEEEKEKRSVPDRQRHMVGCGEVGCGR